jgi:hypothetical protein
VSELRDLLAVESPSRKRPPQGRFATNTALRLSRLACVFVFACALGLGGGVACGDIDGSSGHFPGTVVYESPTHDFHFHMLQPPWIPIPLPTGTFFAVPPTEVVAIPTEADALYSLHIDRMTGDAQAAFSAAAGTQQPPWDLMQSQTVKAGAVTMGVEMSWQEAPTIFRRHAYINGAAAGTSFRLRFTAKKSMRDDPMITQMIASFEPKPSGPGEIAR